MTIRNRHELGIMFANAFAYHEGPLAMLGKLTQTAPEYKAYGTGRLAPVTDTKTPIVNLFQGAPEKNISTSNAEVYCSYIPTPACFGIMRMSQAKAVYFISGNQLRCVSIGASGPVPQATDAIDLPNAKGDKLSAAAAESTVAYSPTWFAGTPAQVQALADQWVGEIKVPKKVTDVSKAVLSTVHMVGPLEGVDHVPAFTLRAPATSTQAVSAGYRDELFMSVVRVFASLTWTGSETVGQTQVDLRTATGTHILKPGKNIAALLVADDTKIIAWGINTNDANGTRHAETNAIQAYQQDQGTALPANVRLYTSLQPCFMCAGLYAHAGGSNCLFDQKDPGMVGNTALAATEQAYTGRFSAQGSFGDVLNASNALQIQHGKQVRAPDYLKTQGAAQIYGFAMQRFITLGMRATPGAEKRLWDECLRFLKSGPLGPVMQRPDLWLID